MFAKGIHEWDSLGRKPAPAPWFKHLWSHHFEPMGPDMTNSSHQWFAVMVKPRFEKCVSGFLRSKGYEEFNPVTSHRQKWSDRWKIVEFPLFPRYLFCRFDFHNRVHILNTPGVLRIVGFGPTP